jgi:hypothetical protein
MSPSLELAPLASCSTFILKGLQSPGKNVLVQQSDFSLHLRIGRLLIFSPSELAAYTVYLFDYSHPVITSITSAFC